MSGREVPLRGPGESSAPHRIIAVDGPAASGKSTIASRLAEKLGLPFLDSGLLYRAVADALLRSGQVPDDPEAAVLASRALDPAQLDPVRLRDEAVGAAASLVAVVPEVRAALLATQREFGADGPGAVIAGRDIGTVVRPDATHKIFVTASVEERARRRFRELQSRGTTAIYARVLEEMRERDERDRTRVVSPLLPATEAFVIDTTSCDIETAFAKIERFVLAQSAS